MKDVIDALQRPVAAHEERGTGLGPAFQDHEPFAGRVAFQLCECRLETSEWYSVRRPSRGALDATEPTFDAVLAEKPIEKEVQRGKSLVIREGLEGWVEIRRVDPLACLVSLVGDRELVAIDRHAVDRELRTSAGLARG